MQGAKWDWDDADWFKKPKTKSAWRFSKQVVEGNNFSSDSIERYSQLVRVHWYVQAFIWQHLWLETKTLRHDAPTWGSGLLDRAQRKEHPLDRCYNIHWTASNKSTAWLTTKWCWVCETSTPIFLHLPWYWKCLYHVSPSRLSKHRPRSGKPLAFRGRSGKGWGNFGASAVDTGVKGLFLLFDELQRHWMSSLIAFIF